MNGTDEELAREAKRGSSAAFESLVRRNQSLVRGFLRRMADAATADDLAQETFVVAWRKIGTFEEKGSFRGWICRIAYTQFLQARRSQQSALKRDTAAFLDSDQVTEADAAGAEARLDLERAMKVLSQEQRAAVSLCYGEGMSHAEAAEALGLPLGTLKSHVLRGRERMLAVLREREGL